MQPNEREETDEEFLARLAANRAKRREAAKPKIEVTVSPKLAEAVKAHPDSLRVSAKAADDTVVVERARPKEIVEAIDVDREGRIARARHVDCATGDVSIVEYRGGYRLPPGAAHEYNPLDALRRAGDE
jgi:hypothetical protein